MATATPECGTPRSFGPEMARKILHDDGAACLTLSLYPPLLRQPPHRHDRPSIALLLSGAVEEQAGSGTVAAASGWLGLKPEDLRHSNCYGPDGAILLTLIVHDPDLWRARGEEGWGWSAAGEAARPLVAAALSGRLPFGALVTEMLALGKSGPAKQGVPPAWLGEVRRLSSHRPGLAVADLARTAGVHRVHLSRSFSRWYGESLSLFRLKRRTELGLRGMLYDGASPAAAASDAGFADQSHFTRAVRRMIGTTPGALRAIRA
jgi:AraC family transcriptional regulator